MVSEILFFATSTILANIPHGYISQIGTPPQKDKLSHGTVLVSVRVIQEGLWHGSQTEKVVNHGSLISKFHFPESQHKQERYSIFNNQLLC